VGEEILQSAVVKIGVVADAIIGFTVDTNAEGLTVHTDCCLSIWCLEDKDVTFLILLATTVLFLVGGEFLHLVRS
jgi:hypothetical protein